jgi:cellulose synthase/poly-beta-1,6-N-acetylglucosamine synthase-like glycosyltransferase
MATFELNLILIWLCGYLLFVLLAARANMKKQHDEIKGFPLDELTVIVPFRNERHNLEQLCNYLGQQHSKPRHVIFVNDHSFDGSATMLGFYLKNEHFSYEILHLDEDISGKKEAIMTAVKMAKTKYCHTLDADVHFKPDFFESLPNPGENDMLILPVRMTGFQCFTFILELEYGSFQILQAMVAYNKPLMASGANLIFNREAYLKYNKLEEHAHRNSGDDQYALAQFLKHKLKVKSFFDLRLAVLTDTPDNLTQLITQRVRWMGNNTQGKDWRASFFAVLLFLLNSSFLGLLVWSVLRLNLFTVVVLLSVKIGLDYVLYLPWFKRNRTWELQKYMPLLSVFYPIYLVILPFSFLLLGRKIKWKNRTITQ